MSVASGYTAAGGPVLFALLIGCAPGDLDADEARHVFDALSSVNGDTWARVYATSAPVVSAGDTGDTGDTGTGTLPPDTGAADAHAKSLTWHTAIDGGSFAGTVDGPGSWTGTVQIDGSYVLLLVDDTGWSSVWSMQVTWDDVQWADMRLDSAFQWNLKAEVEPDGAFTYTAAITGDVTARGGARGTGALDYRTSAVFGGGQYTLSATGTVGGHDIGSSWDATDTFGF